MNYAQGNTRSKPDGFLHVQNFTVTRHAGMAAVVWTHLLDASQREDINRILVEKASQDSLRDIRDWKEPRELYQLKHGTVRFRKEWLKENFKQVVHGYTKLVGLPVVNEFIDKLVDEYGSLES